MSLQQPRGITPNSTSTLTETTSGVTDLPLVPKPLTSDLAISARTVSKMYPLYAQPSDRLKQSLWYALPGLLRGRPRQFYREFWALRNVSFEVQKGEAFGIIGQNGSGKSTLLQIIAGTLTPTAGEVQVNGQVAALLELGSGFNPEFSGRENVYLNGSILGFSREQMDERFDEIAAFADIGEFLDQPVKFYSSGMFVRLAFAVQACVDPDILIIDEALAVGDIFFRQKCYKRLEALRERGVAIVLVSHSHLDVEQFCQRTLLLHHGEAIFLGGASEAIKRYYLLEQGQKKTRATLPPKPEPANTVESTPNESSAENHFWPNREAFLDISAVAEVSTGAARCTGVALCNEQGQPCHLFEQGETASFFYEFELLEDIEVPIGGIVLQNEKGILVHGKNSLQHDSQVPTWVGRGHRLRFRQDITLEIATGEYSFEVGLATISNYDYKNRNYYSNIELRTKTTRICHLPATGYFAVTLRHDTTPVQLLYHGLVNLSGSCQLIIAGPDGVEPQSIVSHKNGQKNNSEPDVILDNAWLSKETVTSLARQSPLKQVETPTIFHITHWKAGSQWVHKILQKCVPDHIIPPEVGEVQFLAQPLKSGGVYPTVYVTKQQFESVRLPSPWRRFVIIRDLRDTLISGYFSIRISHPGTNPQIAKWRSVLNSLELEDGLTYLMDEWLPFCSRIQASWAGTNEPLIHYEELLENDVETLEKVLLKKCHLPVSQERFREAVLATRFEKVTGGRLRGQENIEAHERKAIAGDWKNYFSEDIKQAFKIRYGSLLVATGYEKDLSW